MTKSSPFGFTLSNLQGEKTSAHAGARNFCLDTIKEFYGFDYNSEWHLDLDSLLLEEDKNHYSSVNRGAFWVLSSADGALVATAGLRALEWKPEIVRILAQRYPDSGRIGSLWRVYVRKDQRGRGLGKWLSRLAEVEAAQMGYDTMYLHASSDSMATIGFWRSLGYVEFGDWGFSTHFDKALHVDEPERMSA